MGTDKRARQKEGRQQRLAASAEAQRRARARRRLIRVGVLAAVAVAVVVLFVVLRGGDDDEPASDEAVETVLPARVDPPPPGETLTEPAECPPIDGSGPRVTAFTDDELPSCIDPDGSYTATLTLADRPELVVELDAAGAPDAVNAFVVLARYGYYDGSAIFGTDPGTGTLIGGAPTTNSLADPGPGFAVPVGVDERHEVGALVLDANGGFRIVARSANIEVRGGTTIGSLDSTSTTVAAAILDLDVPAPGSLTDRGPSEPIVVESITIAEG